MALQDGLPNPWAGELDDFYCPDNERHPPSISLFFLPPFEYIDNAPSRREEI